MQALSDWQRQPASCCALTENVLNMKTGQNQAGLASRAPTRHTIKDIIYQVIQNEIEVIRVAAASAALVAIVE